MRLVTFALIGATLSACATTSRVVEPTVITVPVDKPVAVSCVPDTVPEPPTFSDSLAALLAAPDGAERYRLVVAGRAERDARLGILEPVIAGCRKPAAH